MNKKSEYLINSIFEKLKKNKMGKLNLNKKELENFISFLLKNN